MHHKPDLADVYTAHVRDIYAFFAYRFGTRSEAEDLTQATFERAVKAWKRYDPERASPKTWLTAIATNLAIDHMRSDRSRLQSTLDDAGLELLGTRPEAAPPDLDPDLAAALADLGERDRLVIALRFGGDLTGAEIANLLGLSLANVQQIQSRSLRRLRGLLAAEERQR